MASIAESVELSSNVLDFLISSSENGGNKDSTGSLLESSAVVGLHNSSYLVGSQRKNRLLLYNVCSCTDENGENTFDMVQSMLPGGLSIVGLVCGGLCLETVKEVADYCVESEPSCKYLILLTQLASTENAFGILADDLDILEFWKASAWDIGDTKVADIAPRLGKLSLESALESSITLIAHANVHMDIVMSEDEIQDSISAAVTAQESLIFSQQRAVFKPRHLSAVLVAATSQLVSDGSTVLTTVSDIIQAQRAALAGGEEDAGTKKKKTMDYRADNDFIEFDLLQRISGNDLVDSMHHSVPVLRRELCRDNKFITMSIPIKAFSIVDQSTKIVEISTFLLQSMRRQLKLGGQCVIDHSDFNTLQFVPVESQSVLPRQLRHFLSQYFPKVINELDPLQIAGREHLHDIWRLPRDRPVFKKSNSFRFPAECGSIVRNIHKHVPNSNVHGTITVVPGIYQYHHYMQDDFNDKGWGCAYRSFQTIWSWLMLQGYTDRPVPSHRQIQESLVRVGDKGDSFVGSKLWVGSLELSFVLNEMLNMDSRILSVSSGPELESKARELAHHFMKEGTPVMIGGGVLAHTIIGVDFNDATGDVKYLVLDPHYTGEDSVKTIVEKGWCGWKPVTFWEANTFYNMLLPICPKLC